MNNRTGTVGETASDDLPLLPGDADSQLDFIGDIIRGESVEDDALQMMIIEMFLNDDSHFAHMEPEEKELTHITLMRRELELLKRLKQPGQGFDIRAYLERHLFYYASAEGRADVGERVHAAALRLIRDYPVVARIFDAREGVKGALMVIPETNVEQLTDMTQLNERVLSLIDELAELKYRLESGDLIRRAADLKSATLRPQDFGLDDSFQPLHRGETRTRQFDDLQSYLLRLESVARSSRNGGMTSLIYPQEGKREFHINLLSHIDEDVESAISLAPDDSGVSDSFSIYMQDKSGAQVHDTYYAGAHRAGWNSDLKGVQCSFGGVQAEDSQYIYRPHHSPQGIESRDEVSVQRCQQSVVVLQDMVNRLRTVVSEYTRILDEAGAKYEFLVALPSLPANLPALGPASTKPPRRGVPARRKPAPPLPGRPRPRKVPDHARRLRKKRLAPPPTVMEKKVVEAKPVPKKSAPKKPAEKAEKLEKMRNGVYVLKPLADNLHKVITFKSAPPLVERQNGSASRWQLSLPSQELEFKFRGDREKKWYIDYSHEGNGHKVEIQMGEGTREESYQFVPVSMTVDGEEYPVDAIPKDVYGILRELKEAIS